MQATANNEIGKIKDFWDNRSAYTNQPVFWRALINGMQATTADESNEETEETDGNEAEETETACIEAFDNFSGKYKAIKAELVKDVYEAALAQKGAGGGSDFGFTLSKFSKYNSLAVAGFGMYNDCNFDYYTMAVGFNTQSVAGLFNFGTNIYYRITSTDETTITQLVSGLAEGNPYTVGSMVGTYFRDLLAVEIPDTTEVSDGYTLASAGQQQ